MKFVIVLALACVVAADVSILRSQYLPPRDYLAPREDLPLVDNDATVLVPEETVQEDEFAPKLLPDVPETERSTKFPILLEEPLSLVPNVADEPELAHSFDDEDGYKYKSPY